MNPQHSSGAAPSTAGRWFDRLLFGLACLAGAIIVLIELAIGFEVIARYFFNRPTRWVVEFSEYGLLFIAFLAGAWVLKEEGHVRVEMLVETLSPALRKRVFVITSIAGALMCATLAWVSATYTWQLYEQGEVLFRSVVIPKWPLLAIVAIGMALLAVQFLRCALRGQTAPSSAGF